MGGWGSTSKEKEIKKKLINFFTILWGLIRLKEEEYISYIINHKQIIHHDEILSRDKVTYFPIPAVTVGERARFP